MGGDVTAARGQAEEGKEVMYFRKDDNAFQRITSAQLRAALDDPRLPDSFEVEVSSTYPALIIRTGEDDEDPEGFWYIGYIDMFDAEYHPRERGERDGMNNINEGAVEVAMPRRAREVAA